MHASYPARFLLNVIEHLAARKSESPQVSDLFRESTHLIYNENQEISGFLRVRLQAVHGNIENKLTGSLPCSASVLLPLPRSRGAEVWAASVKLLSSVSGLG